MLRVQRIAPQSIEIIAQMDKTHHVATLLDVGGWAFTSDTSNLDIYFPALSIESELQEHGIKK